MSHLVGAYCFEPVHENAAAEDAWYRTLAAEPLIGGLELPFRGTVHPAGLERLAQLLDPAWRNVVTDIPATDARSRTDARYGLASTDADRRDRALADARTLFTEVTELTALVGAGSVSAVCVHSAPPVRGGHSSPAAFEASLGRIASWDWGEITLCVEHVDAAVPEHAPEKGYLRLEDEIAAVQHAGAAAGRRILQSVNWGRSAIEARSATGPLDHLAALRAAGTLGGLIFSGAAQTRIGDLAPWCDAHLALAEADPGSLLTPAALAACSELIAGAAPVFLGVKMRSPIAAVTFDERIAPTLDALALLP